MHLFSLKIFNEKRRTFNVVRACKIRSYLLFSFHDVNDSLSLLFSQNYLKFSGGV